MQREVDEAEPHFNVMGGSTYIGDMAKIPSPPKTAAASKRTSNATTHYGDNYAPRKGEKTHVDEPAAPVVRPEASDKIPPLAPFAIRSAHPPTPSAFHAPCTC